ncbi:MAG: hypothetical protein KDA96_02070, partial [Planctomycetaceae bacterium]|nr:hypothetical protein [Planctomycetaceae bacterium]
IDPFHRGNRLSGEDVEELIREAGYPPLPQFLTARSEVQIIERMLNNLLGLAEADRDDRRVLSYLEILVPLAPDDPDYHRKRLEMRARTGRLDLAIEDANWFIDHNPPGVDLDRLYQLRSMLEQQKADLESTGNAN